MSDPRLLSVQEFSRLRNIDRRYEELYSNTWKSLISRQYNINYPGRYPILFYAFFPVIEDTGFLWEILEEIPKEYAEIFISLLGRDILQADSLEDVLTVTYDLSDELDVLVSYGFAAEDRPINFQVLVIDKDSEDAIFDFVILGDPSNLDFMPEELQRLLDLLKDNPREYNRRITYFLSHYNLRAEEGNGGFIIFKSDTEKGFMKLGARDYLVFQK